MGYCQHLTEKVRLTGIRIQVFFRIKYRVRKLANLQQVCRTYFSEQSLVQQKILQVRHIFQILY